MPPYLSGVVLPAVFQQTELTCLLGGIQDRSQKMSYTAERCWGLRRPGPWKQRVLLQLYSVPHMAGFSPVSRSVRPACAEAGSLPLLWHLSQIGLLSSLNTLYQST